MSDRTYNNGVQDGRLDSMEQTCKLTREQVRVDMARTFDMLTAISEQVWVLKGKAAAWGAFGGLLGAGVIAIFVHLFGK